MIIILFLVLGGLGWVYSYRYFGFSILMLAIVLLSEKDKSHKAYVKGTYESPAKTIVLQPINR